MLPWILLGTAAVIGGGIALFKSGEKKSEKENLKGIMTPQRDVILATGLTLKDPAKIVPLAQAFADQGLPGQAAQLNRQAVQIAQAQAIPSSGSSVTDAAIRAASATLLDTAQSAFTPLGPLTGPKVTIQEQINQATESGGGILKAVVGNLPSIQMALNAVTGTNLDVDGKKGPATTKAIRDFQTSQHLTVDGDPGPQTVNALNAKLGV